MTRAPAGSSATKKRASNRRGRIGGVTHLESGVSRSVRSRRSRSSAIWAKLASPPTSAVRACETDRGREATVASLGQEDARLLEQLADRGDVEADRHRRLQVAAERHGCLGRIGRRPLDQRGVRIAAVETAAGEDVHVRRERHRRRSPRQEDLGAAPSLTQQDDRRRQAWLDSLEGHGASSKVRTNDHSQWPGSYSMSRDGSRTNPSDV